MSNPGGPPCDVAHKGKLCDPGVVDEDTGLVQEGPVGGEFVLEDEPVPVLVGTHLGVGGRVPLARLGLHQESLDDDVVKLLVNIPFLPVDVFAWLGLFLGIP